MKNSIKKKTILASLFFSVFLACFLQISAFANTCQLIGNSELLTRKNIEYKAGMLFNGYPIQEIQKRTSK
jgi:hypothetical protein